MPKGQKERYTIGAKGTYGCKGYPVVGAGGKVHGCHTSRASARQQQAAIYASTGDSKKAQEILDLMKYEEDMAKAWSVVSDHPSCDGFAVVGDSGNVYGCFKTRAEADAAVASHNSDHNNGAEDNSNDMHMGKFWGGTAFDFKK